MIYAMWRPRLRKSRSRRRRRTDLCHPSVSWHMFNMFVPCVIIDGHHRHMSLVLTLQDVRRLRLASRPTKMISFDLLPARDAQTLGSGLQRKLFRPQLALPNALKLRSCDSQWVEAGVHFAYTYKSVSFVL